MATTVTLDAGGGDSITLPAPAHATGPYTYPQIIGRTWGGGVRVADLGDGSDHTALEITWQGLTEDEYDSLATFIRTTVSWATTAFTYTDHHGTAHTHMHYVGGLPEFAQEEYDWWSGTLRLRKDESA